MAAVLPSSACFRGPAAPSSPARGARRPAAALRSTTAETASNSSAAALGLSNILPAEGLTDGQRRKLELQAQAQAALAAENSWWQDVSDAPANFVTAASPKHFKQLIMGAGAGRLVVVDYLKPSCGACRRLHPKLKQIAASNPETLFVKVNVESSEEMRELGRGMQVANLPWFHVFLAGEIKASFSANITTVGNLRAEIAANKPCTDPGCSVY